MVKLVSGGQQAVYHIIYIYQHFKIYDFLAVNFLIMKENPYILISFEIEILSISFPELLLS